MELIHNNLPALVVLLPLLMGLLTAIIGRRGLGWWMAMATNGAVLAIALQLLYNVMHHESYHITYLMGSWPAPFGIALEVDPLSAAVLVVVATIACALTLYARKSVASEVQKNRLHFFYALWLFCTTGLFGMTITGDAFNLYVLLEISSLSTYTLVALGRSRNRRALTAAINYLVLGSIGANFYLLGIAYMYMVTGSLNIADIHHILVTDIYPTWGTDTPKYQTTVIVGFAFMAVGLSLKLALFPLHGWLPNAYTYAPSAVSGLLASTATKVGAYVFIRMIYTMVGVEFAFDLLRTQYALMASAGLAIVAGSWLALKQTNLKKMLAYSSIGQIGYITLGFALNNVNGLTASIIHLFNHALTKGGMFMALGVVVYRLGNARIKDVAGLGRKLPVTMAVFTAGGLGLIGVPLTAGFISKWYLVTGAIQAKRYEMAAIVLFGSVLALMYVWRVVEQIYFGKRDENAARIKEAPITMLIPMVLLMGSSIYFGIDARATSWVAQTAAELLLGGKA